MLLRPGGVGGEERLDQLEIAHRHRVQDHRLGAVEVRRAIEVIERGALCVAQVMEDRSGGADGGRPVGEAHAIEREQLEVIAQRAVGVVLGEDPLFEFGAHEARRGARGVVAGEQRQIAREEDFARAQLLQRAGHFARVELRHAKFAGGDVDVSDRRPIARARHRREEIILARAHQVGVHGGAGSDHARDLAAHQLLGLLGIFHLVADGDPMAFLNEARDVAFGRVEGDAAHRDGGAFFLIAGGKGDFEFAGGHHGIFEEELVEIAQAEHQQRVGDLLFDAVVLPHQRRGGVRGHRHQSFVGQAILPAADFQSALPLAECSGQAGWKAGCGQDCPPHKTADHA